MTTVLTPIMESTLSAEAKATLEEKLSSEKFAVQNLEKYSLVIARLGEFLHKLLAFKKN